VIYTPYVERRAPVEHGTRGRTSARRSRARPAAPRRRGTLEALGLNPPALGRASRKLVQFNPRAAIANADEYPTLAEREKFLRVLLSMRGASRRASVSQATAAASATDVIRSNAAFAEGGRSDCFGVTALFCHRRACRSTDRCDWYATSDGRNG
jgi:hypothetical protein